jgi:hypothetical protein
LYTNKQQHKKIAIISLDLKKAFDHVNTTMLLTKLIQDRAPPYLVNWMAGTLLNRPIQIASNHTLSNIQYTSTGVLQGGTLAPLQFTYYINTTLHNPLPDTHSVYAYADDIALMLVADTQHQLENIAKTALHSLIRRLKQIDCEISYQKTKLLTINCRIPHITYKHEKILHVKQHKILGITIDKTLTFNTHTQNMLKRMNASLQWLRSIAKRFNIRKRRTLALQYVLSVLDYSLLAIYPFLSPSNKKHLNRIISQTARFILQVPSSTPTTYCILEANLVNLEDRALLLALRHGHKHQNHLNPICKTLTTTYQTHSILQQLPPAQRQQLQHSPPKILTPLLRNIELQTLAQTKPHLAAYIATPQKRLTPTTSLMTRLRTGHACTNQWLARMKCIPPTPCRLCGLEPETVHHLLVACPHPQAMKERKKHIFKKFQGIFLETPEDQLKFLLTRAPPPQIQKVKESTLEAYLKALNIQL